MPLRESLPLGIPASSISHELLPTYAPVAVPPSASVSDSPVFAPDASHDEHLPTIDIATPGQSLHQSPEQASPISFTTGDAPVNASGVQMRGRKPAIAAAGTFLSFFTFSQIYQNALFPKITPISERAEERQWVASSKSWMDRKVCSWFGMCGLAHLNKAGWTKLDNYKKAPQASLHDHSSNQNK